MKVVHPCVFSQDIKKQTNTPFQHPWQGPCSPQRPFWTLGHHPLPPEDDRTQEETLRFGFGRSAQALTYHGVPVGTKASLWAPHSPACWSSTWPPPRPTRSECAAEPVWEKQECLCQNRVIIQHTDYVQVKLKWDEFRFRWIGPRLCDLDENPRFPPVWLPPLGCRAPWAAAGTPGWRPESLSLGPTARMAPFLSSSKKKRKSSVAYTLKINK